jgi:hypothetical protein
VRKGRVIAIWLDFIPCKIDRRRDLVVVVSRFSSLPAQEPPDKQGEEDKSDDTTCSATCYRADICRARLGSRGGRRCTGSVCGVDGAVHDYIVQSQGISTGSTGISDQ